MLTSRGFWLLLTSSVALLGSAAIGQLDLVLLAASFVIWIGVSWTIFALRAGTIERRLKLERRIKLERHGAGQPAGRRLLWAEQTLHMTARVVAIGRLGSFLLQFGDRLPRSARVTRDHQVADPPRPPWNGVGEYCLEYAFQPLAAGRLRFEGLYFAVSDPLGFFQRTGFLRQPSHWLVLPPFPPPTGESRAPTKKRLNLLPARGLHRHLRAGSASELLDLRDYTPGDPPRMIAWKASARRRALMTKLFESEVPIRATLFLDASSQARRGRGRGADPGRGLDASGQDGFSQLNRLATHIARALLAAHDPVGLCVVHDRRATLLSARPGSRQMMRILSRIGESAAEPLEPVHCPAEPLIEPALALTRDIDPQLYDWSAPTAQAWGWLASGWRAGRLWVSILVTLGAALAYFSPKARAFDPATWLLFLGLLAGAVTVGRLVGIHRWTLWPKRPDRRRRHLAAILASWSGAPLPEQARLEWDDRALSHAAQRYLMDHDVPIDQMDVPRLSAPQFPISLLCRHILRAVAHGRDNELLVLLVDLLEQREEWEPLERALRVAVARHHQVVIVCPVLDGTEINPDLAALRGVMAWMKIPVLAATDDRALGQILGRVERMRFAAR